MCWRYDTGHGLILDRITYQPKGERRPIPVLNSAKLAQIHVPYDDGNAEYDDLTGAGFGWGLQNLAPAECPGGTVTKVRVPEMGTVDGLCTTTRARGHAYRLAGDEGTKVWQAQGKDLLVYTVNKVAWYEYGENLANPIVWVNIGFHHIARDEDQQPMPVHWEGFQLAARDVTSMNPLTPADLADQNGHHDHGS